MIRRLSPDDAEAYAALRREMLLDSPLSFGASPEDCQASTPANARVMLERSASAVFGAFSSETRQLIGSVGLYQDTKLKFAHKIHIWGMYVQPSARKRGVAAALLDAAIAYARTVEYVGWIHLSVTASAPNAKRLYERAGFSVWGTEPDAIRHGGSSADEYHMALRLS